MERHFIDRAPIADEVKAFLSAAAVADELESAKFGRSNCCRLEQAVACHLADHEAAYGRAAVLPKHHAMMHVPSQVRRDGMFLDCFVGEREHNSVKPLCREIRNISKFEETTMAYMQLTQERKLQHVGQRGRLSDWMPCAISGPRCTSGCRFCQGSRQSALQDCFFCCRRRCAAGHCSWCDYCLGGNDWSRDDLRCGVDSRPNSAPLGALRCVQKNGRRANVDA